MRFVIVRDNDSADCIDVKAQLVALCTAAFGNPKLNSPALRKRYADPDSWQKPSVELKRQVPGFQKLSGARAMAARLNQAGNTSRSFRVFVTAVRQMATEQGYVPIPN